jgi:hypothetical protein
MGFDVKSVVYSTMMRPVTPFIHTMTVSPIDAAIEAM